MTTLIRTGAVAAVVLAATVAHAGGDHEMLAAEQEMKIARDHLQAAGTDYGGHRRAALDHLDAALREIHDGIKFSRSGSSGPASSPHGEHGATPPSHEPGAEDED